MAQRNGDPLALVMGDVDMVRALGIAGIPSAFFGVANEPARFSSHVRVSLPWIDPWERQDQLVAALLDFARSQTEAPILFPQTDAALLLASRHRGRLAEGMRMMLADRDLIDQLVDKRRFQALAPRHDLPVPPAQHLRPAPGDPPPALDVPYPVVVKPLTRIPAWAALAGSGKALRVPGRDDLAALWPRLTKLRTEFLAQQLVRGPESRIESFHVYVDVSGAIVGEFTGGKIRTFPRDYGAQHRRRARLAAGCRRGRPRCGGPPRRAGRRQARLQARRPQAGCTCSRSTRGSTSGTTRSRSPA